MGVRKRKTRDTRSHPSMSSDDTSATVDSNKPAVHHREYDERELPPLEEEPAEEDPHNISLNEEMEMIAFSSMDIPAIELPTTHPPLGMLSFDTDNVSVMSNISSTQSVAIVPTNLCCSRLLAPRRSQHPGSSGTMGVLYGQLSSVAESGHEALVGACCGEKSRLSRNPDGKITARGTIDEPIYYKALGCVAQSSSRPDNCGGVYRVETAASARTREEAQIANSREDRFWITASAVGSVSSDPRICDMAGCIRDMPASLIDIEENFANGINEVETMLAESAWQLGEANESLENNGVENQIANGASSSRMSDLITSINDLSIIEPDDGDSCHFFGIEMALEEASYEFNTGNSDAVENDALRSISSGHDSTGSMSELVESTQEIVAPPEQNETSTSVHSTGTNEVEGPAGRIVLSYADRPVDQERETHVKPVHGSSLPAKVKKPKSSSKSLFKRIKRLVFGKGGNKRKGRGQGMASDHCAPLKSEHRSTASREALSNANSFRKSVNPARSDGPISRNESSISEFFPTTASCETTLDTSLDASHFENDVVKLFNAADSESIQFVVSSNRYPNKELKT